MLLAWTMFVGVLGLAAYFVLDAAVWSARPTAADLERGAALIRSQYSDAETRVGRVRLAPAGLCAMRGTAELVDQRSTAPIRRLDCVVTIAGKDSFTATCR